MFWRPDHSMKVNWDVLRDYKETSKVCFVYLECKLQQDRYVWCMFDVYASSNARKRYKE